MITGKVILYTHQRELSGGYPIKVRLTDGKTKKSTYIRTGYYSKRKDFDTEPKRSHPQYSELIYDYTDWIKKIATLLPRANRNKWSLEYLVKQFKQEEYFDADQFIGGLNLSESTKQIYRRGVKWLQCNDFANLSGEYVSRRVARWPHSNNGLNIYIRSLNALWNKAVSQGYLRGENPFVGKTLPSERTRSKSLSLEELKIVFDCRESLYKDMFLLQLYLGGIDFVDLWNLNYREHYQWSDKNHISFCISL